MNVMTIEDPVEYVFPKVNQIQINEQAGLTFATGLKSILRQDPDVILVGEVRDVETARIAVQSALTGHLVLSSVHAIDSVSAHVPPARHGRRGVPRHLGDRRRRRAAARAPHLRIVRDAYEPTPQELALYRKLGGSAEGRLDARRRLQMCGGTRLLRPHRRVRGAHAHRRAAPGDHRRPHAARDAASSRSTTGCARCRPRRWTSSPTT